MSTKEMSDALEAALKAWHQPTDEVVLLKLVPYLAHQIKTDWAEVRPPSPQQLTNQLLLDFLEILSTRDNDAAKLLRGRYIDDKTGFAVANSLGISESAFYRRRRNALTALSEVAVSQEARAKQKQISRLEGRLELPTYQNLFGLDSLRTRLTNLLCSQTDVRLFCLSGIGGIGKTALADALARDIIAEGCFSDLAWISARQQQFAPWGEIQETGQPVLTSAELITALNEQLSDNLAPPRSPGESLQALKTRLKTHPHLIILDNLETVADYQELLPLLRELSQWAWILLTSRVSIHAQPDVHLVTLTELLLDDATELIRDEAQRRGIIDLTRASGETINQIYKVAGGSPLALKLIIGQVQIRSLPVVLTDLIEAQGRQAEALYTYIYRQAWGLLDDVARRVLLTMPLVAAPGTTLEHLAGTTGLERDQLYDALEQLITLSLVNVGGSLTERRYQIHRLTETFLHTQVTQWMT